MATRNYIVHNVTNGPSKWDIMLALFDNKSHKRLLSFTAEYETDVVGLEVCPYEMRILVSSVKKLKDNTAERWQIEGYDTKHRRFVTLRYSTMTRKGKCEFGREHPDPKDSDFERHHMQVDMPPWTCDWCKKSFSEDDDQPRETHDGETICSTCSEQDEQGLQIARYGRDQNEDDNEDPLEGAVEPVGGSPSKDRPLYNQRTGMLIGHVPIEHPDDSDDE